MIYGILIILAIIFICVVGVWFAIKFYKKKKRIAQEEKNIPKDLLELFDEAEQTMKGGLKEDGTTESPYKILWEIARRNGGTEIAENSRESIRTEQTVDDGELHEQPIRREDIPARTTTVTNKDRSTVRKPGRNNFKRVISRIRRRNS